MDGVTTENETPIDALLGRAEPVPPPANDPPVGDDQAEGKRKTQSAVLVELAADAALFKTPEGEAFADLPNGGHRETYPLRDRGFRDWLAHRFYVVEGRAPTANALQDALSVLQGKAQFEGATREVFVRVAHEGGAIYLDLGRPDWEAVEVTADGWRLVANPPVRFRRPRGLLPLPVPVEGGDLAELWGVLNVHGDDRALLLGWLVMLFHPRGPFPPAILRGEQGSGKTSAAGVLKSIIDPAKAGLRAEPREVRDLMIAAQSARLLAYDNLSSIPAWLSDALCRLSTGGGFAVRAHYENAEEVLFEASCPVLINGISDVATRSDLIDRCLFIETKVIGEQARRTKADLDAAFEEMHPRILGALLSAVVAALRNVGSVKLARLPRMADFAVWATAAEPALGLAPGTIVGAFDRNRGEAHGIVLDASPVGAAVIRLMGRAPTWHGTATELHKTLILLTDEGARRSFPAKAKNLSDELRRIAPNLRARGIEATQARTRDARTWHIEKVGFSASPASLSSPLTGDARQRPASAVTQEVTKGDADRAAVTQPVTQVTQGDAGPESCVTAETRYMPCSPGAGDAGDAGDAEITRHSSSGPAAADDDEDFAA